MRRVPAESEAFDPALLPAALHARIETAVAMAERKPGQVPEASRLAILPLRKRLAAERLDSDANVGIVLFLAGLAGLRFLGATWIESFIFATLATGLGSAGWTALRSAAARRRVRALSPEILREAAAFAGFGSVEWAAIEAVRSPRAGTEVRAEVERLLAEDARLVAALDEIGPVDLDPIEADRLRLRLGLARETDPATRAVLEASLALCERRLASAGAALGVRGRIEARRELVLQTLRAAGESLARSETGSELEAVRENAAALGAEVAAIERAVQEMRAV